MFAAMEYRAVEHQTTNGKSAWIVESRPEIIGRPRRPDEDWSVLSSFESQREAELALMELRKAL